MAALSIGWYVAASMITASYLFRLFKISGQNTTRFVTFRDYKLGILR